MFLRLMEEAGIGVRQYQVRRVARGAGRRNRKAFFQQSLAVDALGIIFQNAVLGNLAVARNRSSFAMALAANEGYSQRRHSRARVLDRIDVVVPVAVDTARSQRIAARNRLAVERPGIEFLFAGVAGAALYRRRLVVGKVLAFQIGVAAGTTEAGMYGSREFLAIHVERDGLAGAGRGRALVAMAGETFRSGLVGFGRSACGILQETKRKDDGEQRRNSCLPLLRSNFCFGHINLGLEGDQGLEAPQSSLRDWLFSHPFPALKRRLLSISPSGTGRQVVSALLSATAKLQPGRQGSFDE